MRPLAQSEGHDPPWLLDEPVPGVTALVDDVVVGLEDTVREPVVAHELPDILDRVEFGTAWRQSGDGDVLRHDKLGRGMPACLIHEEQGVSARCHSLADLGKVQGDIAGRQAALAVAPGAHALVLMDQAGWHMTGKLEVSANISIVALPARCPELNPVENIWQFMRDNWLSNRVFTSYDNIVDHCCEAWNQLVDQPWRIMTIGRRQWARRF